VFARPPELAAKLRGQMNKTAVRTGVHAYLCLVTQLSSRQRCAKTFAIATASKNSSCGASRGRRSSPRKGAGSSTASSPLATRATPVVLSSRAQANWSALPEGYALLVEERPVDERQVTPGALLHVRASGQRDEEDRHDVRRRREATATERVTVLDDEKRVEWLKARGRAGRFSLVPDRGGAGRSRHRENERYRQARLSRIQALFLRGRIKIRRVAVLQRGAARAQARPPRRSVSGSSRFRLTTRLEDLQGLPRFYDGGLPYVETPDRPSSTP